MILMTLTSFISALPLNPQPLPPGEHVGPHVGERSALPLNPQPLPPGVHAGPRVGERSALPVINRSADGSKEQ
jgi:hypothetical protein